MKNLTPEDAGSSAVALAIAKRILIEPMFDDIRMVMNNYHPESVEVFCGHLAREVDEELFSHGLSLRMIESQDTDITLTPSEQGKLDGILAKSRGDSACEANRISVNSSYGYRKKK